MLTPSCVEAVLPLCGKLKGYAVQCRHTSSALMYSVPLVWRTLKLLHMSSAITCPARVTSTAKIQGRCKIPLLTFQPDQKLYEHG